MVGISPHRYIICFPRNLRFSQISLRPIEHNRTLKIRTNQSSPLQGEIEGVGNFKTTRTVLGLTSQATRMHKQTHSLYKYPAGITRLYSPILTFTPSLSKHTILSSFRNSVTFYLKLIGHLFQLASTCNKNHIHLLILCIGYSQRNCIKIQLTDLSRGPSRYGQ